ncbi:MAG: hypothetical protein AB2L12_05720 [Smithellaceae bacterium]
MLASLKLLDLMADNADAIARQWAKDVVRNPKTPYYHDMDKDKILPQAVEFYKQLSRIYNTKDPFTPIQKFMGKFAEERFNEGIPLHEALYAIVLMRRHIWLYAEFQAIFITVVEQLQAMDSLTRTILMFDYIAYSLSEKYVTLMNRNPKKK